MSSDSTKIIVQADYSWKKDRRELFRPPYLRNMRIRIGDKGLLCITYLLLILLFLRAQLVSGPYEQAIRARLAQPSPQQALVSK